MHVYINTTQILNIFWIGYFTYGLICQGQGLTVLKRSTVYLTTHTRPLFSGRGRGVRWGYPLATNVPAAPSDTLQYYQAVNLCFRNCTLILQYFFCYFERCLPIYKQICCHTPFTPRLNGDLQNCLINVYQVLHSMNTE